MDGGSIESKDSQRSVGIVRVRTKATEFSLVSGYGKDYKESVPI